MSRNGGRPAPSICAPWVQALSSEAGLQRARPGGAAWPGPAYLPHTGGQRARWQWSLKHRFGVRLGAGLGLGVGLGAWASPCLNERAAAWWPLVQSHSPEVWLMRKREGRRRNCSESPGSFCATPHPGPGAFSASHPPRPLATLTPSVPAVGYTQTRCRAPGHPPPRHRLHL